MVVVISMLLSPKVEKEVENGRFVWRSPAHRTGRVGSDVDIPVIHRKELTAEEVVSALEANGVMDLKTINLKGKSTICDAMIFCTAKSVPHMRVRTFFSYLHHIVNQLLLRLFCKYHEVRTGVREIKKT